MQTQHKLRLGYLIAALGMAAVLMLTVTFYDFRIYVKACVDFFSSGRSFFKMYLFLGWSIICLLVLSIRWSAEYIPKRLIVILIAVLMAANIGSHLFFAYRYGVRVAGISVAFADQRFSTTSLAHTHTFKPLLVVGMHALGIDPSSITGDAGVPFYSLLPSAFYAISFVLWILLALLMLRALPACVTRWSPHNRFTLVIVYIISSYTVLRVIPDGGPMLAEFLIYAPLLYVLLSDVEQFTSKRLAIGIVGAVIFALCVIIPGDIAQGELEIYSVRDYFLFAWFIVFVGFASYAIRNLSKRAAVPAVGAALLTALFSRNFYFAYEYQYMHTKIDAGDSIFYQNFFGRKVDYPIVKREGHLMLHAFQATSDGVIGDYLKANHVPPSYAAFSIAGKTCDPSNGFTRSGTIRVIKGPAKIRDGTSEIVDKFKLSRCENTKECDYRYEAGIIGCVADQVSQVVVNHFQNLGLSAFVLTPDKVIT